MELKGCPVRVNPFNARTDSLMDCEKDKCEWWVKAAFPPDFLPIGGCAVKHGGSALAGILGALMMYAGPEGGREGEKEP